MQSVNLSSGETVTFLDYFPHEVAVTFWNVIRDANEGGGTSLPTFKLAIEAMLPFLVQSIVKDGQTVPFSEQWLKKLHEEDYLLLEAAAIAIRDSALAKVKDGEKKD